MELTASQEDYLEAIFGLIRRTGSARVRDIAAQLNVAKSSVTSALQGLAKQSLVNYEPYQLVTLTDQGRGLAERIQRRHQALSRFFTDVLDVDAQIADANACRVEHAVGDGIMRRLTCFVEFMGASSVPAREVPQAFRAHCAQRRRTGVCEGCKVAAKHTSDTGAAAPAEGARMATTLADLRPGDRARIVRVTGGAAGSRRLVEMGLTRGAPVIVLRVAPLGDPVEVQVRGYNLSLRKPEAAVVQVERVE